MAEKSLSSFLTCLTIFIIERIVQMAVPLSNEIEALTKAFTGFGVDEKSLISTLGKWHPEHTKSFRKGTHFFIQDDRLLRVEQRKQPHLRGQPTAVVQYNSWKGGGLIAVSYEARKYGVKRSMRGDEAKQVCPQIQLVQVPVARGKADLSIYRNAGSEVVSILARKGRCERASIDEVYLDLTDAAEAMLAETPPESLEKIDEEALKSHILSLNEDGSDHKDNVREWLHRSDADHHDKLLACGALIVAELRMQVLKETEFTCSAGIAHNKMLAKLVSGMNKPAQQTVVPFTSVKGLLEPLPIKKMKQLGGKLGSSLQIDLGVNTVGELLQFSEEKLQERYGNLVMEHCQGISGEEVEGRLLPKSHGSGKTFPGPRALKKIASVEHWLNELCEELSERLHSDLEQNKRIAHTLTLHARAFKSSDSESQKNFPSKSCPLRYGSAKIKEDALNLFQAGLREYLGSQRIKAQGSHYNGWGITSLSVTASKIVSIPSGTCSIMKYFHGQDQSNCWSSKWMTNLSRGCTIVTLRCLALTPVEPHREFHKEEIGMKNLMHGMRPQDHKRKMVKDKGSSTILRFFQSCNDSSSSPKQEHVRTIDETKASSSSTELCKENLLKQTGTHSGMSILGRDEMRRDVWDYKIDEIDPTVVKELPPEIQEELQVWLRPQKRVANIGKLPIAILYGFNHNLFPGSTQLSSHSITLLSGFLAVISVNVVIAFYICMAMKEPSDKHEPDPAFLANAKARKKCRIEDCGLSAASSLVSCLPPTVRGEMALKLGEKTKRSESAMR
ncbi:DNA polymerase eta [Camellia lanceoleosa]|uniref:DNA polymerase eta n=1 Tax=Camellia lanceoleosa TaxID=1840588 RepID=A0ACC0IGF0_9ERIC|nr:DNA polymerase eta [Camellia lanceoleosa]